MSASCRTTRLLLDIGREIPERGPLARHVAGCLRCQAEVSRRRRMAAALRGLGDVELTAPASLHRGVMASVAATAPDGAPIALPARSRRGAAIAAGAGVAAIAGIAVLVRRGRMAAA